MEESSPRPSAGTTAVPGEVAHGPTGEVDLREGPPGPPAGAEKPLSQLLGDLTKELSLLVHEEVQLAKAELTDKAKTLGIGAALFGAAAAGGLLAAGCLVTCAIAALAVVLPLWLSALVVAVVLLAAAGASAAIALGRMDRGSPPWPEQAMETTKEDVAWTREQLRSGRR
jgi:hypothetical protein